jgi:hypothetical protein
MIKTSRGHVLVPILAFAFGGHALARSTPSPPAADSPILARNPGGPAELAQYEFLAGDWDVTVTMLRPDGEPLVYQAQWHNHWVANGMVMMQEWREPDSHGIELRSFNTLSHKWDGRNLYVPQPGIWYENESEWVKDTMVVTTHRKTPDGTPLINREIYHTIQADRFEIRTEVSTDQGASWKPGGYRLVATRIKG